MWNDIITTSLDKLDPHHLYIDYMDCNDMIKSEPPSSTRKDEYHTHPPSQDYPHISSHQPQHSSHPHHTHPHHRLTAEDIPDEFLHDDSADYDRPHPSATGGELYYYEPSTLVGGAALTFRDGVDDPLGGCEDPGQQSHLGHQPPLDGYVHYTINYNTQTYHSPNTAMGNATGNLSGLNSPSTPTLVSSVAVSAQSPHSIGDDYPPQPPSVGRNSSRTIINSGGRGNVELVTRATPPPPYNQSFSSPSPSSTSTLSSSPHQELNVNTPVKYNR